ncbi:MAG: hypothetical protein ABI721_00370 [Candidatus Dojkabacteria bacterium]
MFRYRILTTLIQIAVLSLILFLGFTNPNYSTNYFIIGYIWLILFTFPSLLSKIIFNKSYFSLTSALCFLYYPITYLFVFFVAKVFAIDINILILTLSILVVLLWNLALISITFTQKAHETRQIITFALGVLILSVTLFGFLTIAGRSVNSVVANDYLVHKTVVFPMANSAETLCFLPSQCSNLFLLDSYTSFYHTFIIIPLGGFKFDPIISSYILDIVFSSFIIILSYITARKFGLKVNYAIFAGLISLVVFDSGAFTATIFIPQTMAFMLTLFIINSQKLNLKSLLISLIVLIPIHFIMGIYCFGIMLLYYLIVEKEILEKFEIRKRLLIILSLSATLLVLLLSISGFGIEKIFQAEEIKKLGFATNYYFPDNLKFLFEMVGLGSFIFIACLIYYYIKGKEDKYNNFLITIITCELVAFLLAPIYANKFLIGIGVFLAIFIIKIIANLKQNEINKLFYCFYTLILIAISFVTQYRFFLLFYTQSNGETSAIVQKDLPMVNFVKNSKLNCFYVSDPQTQLTISALGDKITASGHYMSLDSRRVLFELIKSPNDLRLSKLYSLEEFKGVRTDICFVYSARLKEYVANDNQNWTFNIYNYIVDYQREIDPTDNIERYMVSKNIHSVYNDKYYSIYLLPKSSN